MKTEENVCVETSQTEEIAAAKTGEREEKIGLKDASTVLGKFKDVDALARAYGALEAEFTRRSQRLKELERETENFRGKRNGEGSGVEKLRKNAAVKRAQARAFDAFVAEVNDAAKGKNVASAVEKDARKPVGEGCENVGESDVDVENAAVGLVMESGAKEGNGAAVDTAVDTAMDTVLTTEAQKTEDRTATGNVDGTLQEDVLKETASVAENGTETLSAEELYAQAVKNEDVRLKIIGEYLVSLGKSGAPVTASGLGAIAAPPLKARTVGDAGVMALRYFKKGAVE
ncbi:MAG: hypothetical protein IKD47_06220 [Clostridia bacterium]|nr:hypothetical protein [Clostridia bacterium]